jgi:hypothetical protein
MSPDVAAFPPFAGDLGLRAVAFEPCRTGVQHTPMRLDSAHGEYRPQWLGIYGPKESA